MASVVGNQIRFNGKLYSDWPSLKKALEGANPPIKPLEWVQKNPNKAAVLGAGVNATGDRVATGANATNFKTGSFVNREGQNSGVRGEDGNILTKAELDSRIKTAQDSAAAAASAQDKANADGIINPIIDPIKAKADEGAQRRASDAAGQFVDAIVDFGIAEGFDVAAIIDQLPEAVRTILNDNFGGAQGIMSLIEEGGDLSILAELDRAMENLQANRESIIRNFEVGTSRLSRDLGLGTDRLNTLNARALRQIADQSAGRGLARSGIRNRFEREQGEDHQFAMSEFQNAINDAQEDLQFRTDDLTRQIDSQMTELGVDRGRSVRDFQRGLTDFTESFNRGESDAAFETSQDLAQAGRDASATFGDVLEPTPVQQVTPESLGLGLVAGSPFGNGSAPLPAGDAVAGASNPFRVVGQDPQGKNILERKKKNKKKTNVTNPVNIETREFA